MAELEKGLTEIAALINSISGDSNPFIVQLERMIEEITRKLESSTSTLNSVTGFYNTTKDNYDSAKKSLGTLETDLKKVASSYEELFLLASINYTDTTFSRIGNDASKYVDSQKDLMASYKVQMASLNEEITGYTEELKTLQNRLREAMSARDQLAGYMKQAESGELSLSKNELYNFLRGIVDENGAIVFKEEEISLAAQIITFSENFDLNKSSITVGSVLQRAMAQPEENENSIETFEPVITDNIYDLMSKEETSPEEPLKLPENLIVTDMTPESTLETSSPYLEVVDKKPTDELNPYALIDELEAETPSNVIPFPTSKSVTYDYEEAAKKEQASEINPYALIDDLEAEAPSNVIPFPTSVSHAPEEMIKFNENIRYLQSIGISTEGINKYPTTLYSITVEDIKEGLSIASKFGIKVRGVGDVVALCSRQNIESLLSLAVEIYGSEYTDVAKRTPLCKILEAARQHMKEAEMTKNNLEKYIPEIKELESVKDEVSGNYAYMVALGMEDKLNALVKSTPYAYIINGIYVPRQRFEKNLQRLSNLNISNQDLLLAAVAMGSSLTPDEMASIRTAIESMVPEEEAMRLAA